MQRGGLNPGFRTDWPIFFVYKMVIISLNSLDYWNHQNKFIIIIGDANDLFLVLVVTWPWERQLFSWGFCCISSKKGNKHAIATPSAIVRLQESGEWLGQHLVTSSVSWQLTQWLRVHIKGSYELEYLPIIWGWLSFHDYFKDENVAAESQAYDNVDLLSNSFIHSHIWASLGYHLGSRKKGVRLCCHRV